MDNKPYNGHTNWATWNVCLWLDNDEGLYKDYRAAARRRRFTASTAESYVKELMPSGTPDFDSPADYADVDWDSVAESMNADLEDEEETEESDKADESKDSSPVAKFIERYQIRIAKQERTDSNPNMSADMDHWKVTLLATVDGKPRQFTLTFSQGYGHNGMPPALESILECLNSDCSGIDYGFEDWCSNLGYDNDSRKAEKTYKACLKQQKDIKRWLGADGYESLLAIDWE